MTQRTGIWLAGVVLAGCGGGTSDPNPPPPPPPPPAGTVATVTVSPGSSSPFTGETVQLTATPTSSTGGVISGKTVTWSSGATSIATVSTSGLVSALAAGSATVTATVDGKSGTSQITVQERAALDIAHRVTKAFASKEDSLTTVSGSTTYTLLIPAGALSSPVTIAMTPLGSLQGTLPPGSGLLAGVKLEPSGTQFARPVTLRITNSQPTPAGKVRVGFTATDAGASAGLLLSGPANGGVELLLSHFSLVGLGAVLPADIAALAPTNITGLNADVATTVNIMASNASPATMIQQLTLHFENWYARIRPILTAAGQGDTQLLEAIQEYAYWKFAMDGAARWLGTPSFILVPSLATKSNEGDLFVGAGIDDAIDRANGLCAVQRTFQRAALALFWQTQAEELLPPIVNTALLLDRASVLQDLCVQIVNTELLFPDPVPANQTADLKVRFGVKFGTDPNLLTVIFNLRIDIQGTTADGAVVVPSASDGRFTQTVVPTGQRTFQAVVKACLDALFVGADDVCTTVSVVRSFGRTINGSVTVQTPTGLAGLSDVAKIQGSLLILGGSGNPVVDLEMLTMLQEVTGTITLLDLPNLTSLSGLRNLRTVNGLQLARLPSLATLDALDNLRSIPGTLSLNSLPLVANLQGLGQLLTIGDLQLTNLPLVSSLAGLHLTTLDAGLTVSNLPLLSSLTGPAFTPVLSGSLHLVRDPLLTNLAGLGAVTAIGGSLTIDDIPANLASLAPLKDVAQDVVIAGPSLTSVSSLGLQRIGRRLLITPGTLSQMTTLALPALTQLDELAIAVGGPCARSGSPLLIRLALLDRLTVFNTGTAGPVALPCQYDLELPSLALTPNVVNLTLNGMRDVTLGPVICSVFNAISGTLRSLRFTGAFDIAGAMSITGNALLQSLQGAGQVGNQLSVINNAGLSQAAAQAWAAGVSSPIKSVFGNKIP